MQQIKIITADGPVKVERIFNKFSKDKCVLSSQVVPPMGNRRKWAIMVLYQVNEPCIGVVNE